MRVNEIRFAGRFHRILEQAGLTQAVAWPGWSYERDHVSGKFIQSDFTSFELVTPAWAYKLATELMCENLARRLGYVQKRMRQTLPLGTKPYGLRLRILQIAANNPMARELISDDFDAAITIIRDML
jgi:hypothetical protein